MVYRSFYFGIIIRILLIGINCYFIGWLGWNMDYIHTIIFLYVILVFQIVWLCKYVNKTNRMLTNFFDSIYDVGTSTGFDKIPEQASYKKLAEKLVNVVDLIRATRIEKEHEHHYLKYLIEHLNTGVISIADKSNIDIINNAGTQILGLHNIQYTDDLKLYGKQFYNSIMDIRSGEQKLVQALINDEIVMLSLRASEFILDHKPIKLISFHDIHKEIDQKEMDAWNKIIRVLAHEILSSVSPIRSLSGHLKSLLTNNPSDSLNYIGDAIDGMNIIHERSEGLMKFVETYRKLSDTPKVDINTYSFEQLIIEVSKLCVTEFKIQPKMHMDEATKSIQIFADKSLTIQAILNIIRNSVQALQNVDNPVITLTTSIKRDKAILKIKDNGTGIDPEDMENVFIPFFTTKEGGSGVGLTIAKQLITIQGNQVNIKSDLNTGTEVTIAFECNFS